MADESKAVDLSALEIDDELFAKARAAANEEELVALAAEAGVELTREQAQDVYGRLHASGELTDDELDDVAGGCSSEAEEARYCPKCGAKMKRGTLCSGTGATIFIYRCPNCDPSFDPVCALA